MELARKAAIVTLSKSSPEYDAAIWNLLIGGIACGVGTLITLGTYLAAAPGGTYIVTGGAIFWGGIWFVKGLIQFARLERPAPCPYQHAEPVGKFVYRAAVAGGILFGDALLVVACSCRPPDADNWILLAMLPLTFAAIANVVLWHKMWAAIQDGHAYTSPRKAIGLLFVPLFNLLWVFQVVWGFSKDYNQLVQRRGITARRLPDKLFLASCLLCFVAGVPLFGIIQDAALLFVAEVSGVGHHAWLAVILIQDAARLVLVWMTCDAINALATSHSPVPAAN